jgi:hypothetical protein
MTESDYVFRWSLTIGAGLFLLLCGLAIDFFLTHQSRKR